MSNFKQYIFTTITLLITLSVAASADVQYPSPNDGEYLYVHDYAGILDDMQRSDLQSKLEYVEDSAYVQIAIVTLDSISDNTDIDSYATGLFTAWGIGNSKTDGGALILCVMNSHDVIIRTGYGVEAVLTDAACITIIRRNIVPHFQNGEYYEGLDEAVGTMYGLVSGEFTADDLGSEEEEIPWTTIAIICAVIFVLPIFLPSKYRSLYYNFLFNILLSVLLSGGKGGGGGRSYGGGSTGGGGAKSSW